MDSLREWWGAILALTGFGVWRSGVKAGRAATRLENLERTKDAPQRMLEAPLMIATLSLTTCATAGSDPAPCQRVVEYSTDGKTRAATEIEAIPERAVLVRMMSDCAVLRNQARTYRRKPGRT